MAWRAKNATVLLIDVGHSMSSQAFAGDPQVSRVKKAIDCALGCYRQKLFFAPKHEIEIVLFGAAVTKNALHEGLDDGYNHVYVARDNLIDAPDLSALKFLLEDQPGRMAADALDGLIVAVDMLHKRCAAGKFLPSIHLFTDEASIAPGDADFEEIRKQCQGIGGSGIKLSITLLGNTMEPWRTLIADDKSMEIVPVEQAEITLSC